MIDEVLARHPARALAWPDTVGSATSTDASMLDLFRGSLLWGAVGDAMGREFEGAPGHVVTARHGPDGPKKYEPWHGWTSGPTGTITDDTQLTMVVAESLIAAGGAFDADEYVPRLIQWLDYGRGKGRATTKAVRNLEDGVSWTESASTRAAGNGAAMRAAPIGLVHALDATPAALIRDAILFSMPTHAHPVGVGAAAVVAAGVAYLVRARLLGVLTLDTAAFVSWLADTADAVSPEPMQERRRPTFDMVTLAQRMRQAGDTQTDEAALFDRFWSGALVIESLPCAVNAFVRSPDDPIGVLRASLRAGYDTDTIASMAGNFVGAWVGAEALRATHGPWWDELEYRDALIDLADGLARLA